MSNSPDFLAQAWDWAVNGAGGVPGLPGMVLEYTVNNAVGPAVVAYVAYRVLSGGKDKALNISRTRYIPSGVSHPNGGEYIDQHIKTIDNDFNFTEAFRGTSGKRLAKIVEKATNLTNEENRIAFALLEKVLSEKQLKEDAPIIISKWRGYFSALLNNDDALSNALGARDYPEDKVSLVVPVFEKSPTGGSRKILEIPSEYLMPEGLPTIDKLRVFTGRDDTGKAIYRHAPDHEASERLRTIQKVRWEISQNRAEWFSNYGIDIETGNILTRPMPKPVI